MLTPISMMVAYSFLFLVSNMCKILLNVICICEPSTMQTLNTVTEFAVNHFQDLLPQTHRAHDFSTIKLYSVTVSSPESLVYLHTMK